MGIQSGEDRAEGRGQAATRGSIAAHALQSRADFVVCWQRGARAALHQSMLPASSATSQSRKRLPLSRLGKPAAAALLVLQPQARASRRVAKH